jgi:hypothetical protein
MKNPLTHPSLNRRRVLQLLAASGVAAAGGYVLYEYAPWLDYSGQADRTREPLDGQSTAMVRTRGLIRYATLAASSHNTQPWTFVIKPGLLEIHPDYTRRLPNLDPQGRELWISLGCALENLLIAARAEGYAPEVTYPNATDFIRVRLRADSPQGSPLLNAIPLRQNTRSIYDGQPIQPAALRQLQALPLEPGVTVHFVLEPSGLKTVLEYINHGNLSQYADKPFVHELIHWLRFNQKEALASLDGLYTRCSGNPEVPRWLGQMVVSGTNPQQQADADAQKFRSSSGAVLIASSSDDKTAWVRTGQVYERLALEMTSLKIKSAFLNQPIEVTPIREQFRSAMNLTEAQPQLLVRFGHADQMPRSLRRPVKQVLMPS